VIAGHAEVRQHGRLAAAHHPARAVGLVAEPAGDRERRGVVVERARERALGVEPVEPEVQRGLAQLPSETLSAGTRGPTTSPS
jgi:hypothetical protein